MEDVCMGLKIKRKRRLRWSSWRRRTGRLMEICGSSRGGKKAKEDIQLCTDKAWRRASKKELPIPDASSGR
jgi:hypothetical protein